MRKRWISFVLLVLGSVSGFAHANDDTLSVASLTYGEPTTLDRQWAYDTAWSADGQTLALGLDQELLIADSQDLTHAKSIPVDGTIYDLTFSPDDRAILAVVERAGFNQGATERKLVLWDNTTSRVVDIQDNRAFFVSVQFTPDGQYVVLNVIDAVKDGVIWLFPYDADTMTLGEKREIADGFLPSLQEQEMIAFSLPTMSPDSQKIALSNGRVIAIFDLTSGDLLQSWDYAQANSDLRYLNIQFNRSGDRLAMVPVFDFSTESGEQLNRFITVFDATTFQEVYRVDVEQSFNTFTWSPDGTQLVAGSANLMDTGFEKYQTFIFDAEDGTLVTKIPALMLMPFSEISPNGKQRILYGEDGLVVANSTE